LLCCTDIVFLYRKVLGVYDGKILGMPLIAQYPVLYYWKPTLKVGAPRSNPGGYPKRLEYSFLKYRIPMEVQVLICIDGP
jgi:hypothetical protein